MRVGIFVDSENTTNTGGFGLRYGALRAYANKLGAVLHAVSIIGYDEDLFDSDPVYRDKHNGYWARLEDEGFRVESVPFAKHIFEGGMRKKSQTNVQLAVDIIECSRSLDYIILLTGNGEFSCLVDYLRAQGKFVEVIGFRHVHRDLRDSANRYTCGFTGPGVSRFLPLSPGAAERCRILHWELEGAHGFAGRYIDGRASYDYFVHITKFAPESSKEGWDSAMVDRLFNSRHVIDFAINDVEDGRPEAVDIHVVYTDDEDLATVLNFPGKATREVMSAL